MPDKEKGFTEGEREAVKITLARNSLLGFIKYTKPDYKAGWFHKELCAVLDGFLLDVLAEKSPRLIVCVPPRHGKTEIISKRFPAYLLGRCPDMDIIACSYSAELAGQINREVQRIIDSPEYSALFPGTSLYGRNVRTAAQGSYVRNSDLFEIVGHAGRYRSAGVGGGITGQGGRILLCDDPIRGQEDADSATIRQTIWNWFTSTFYTRCAPGGGVIIVMTRWHHADIVGKLLEMQASGAIEGWQVINYPAIAEHDEKHRKAGEALHPARWPLHVLMERKATIGGRAWQSLYQQRPTAEEGAIFKRQWLRFWTPANLPSDFDQCLSSWDLAFTGKETSDFCVGTIWGKRGADFYLLDMERGRFDFPQVIERFQMMHQKHPQASRKLVEAAANGEALIATLKHKLGGIIPIRPDGSKVARAWAVTAAFEGGNVYLPDPALYPWVNDVCQELEMFPNAAHDDIVDSITQAINYLNKKPGFRVTPELAAQLKQHPQRRFFM